MHPAFRQKDIFWFTQSVMTILEHFFGPSPPLSKRRLSYLLFLSCRFSWGLLFCQPFWKSVGLAVPTIQCTMPIFEHISPDDILLSCDEISPSSLIFQLRVCYCSASAALLACSKKETIDFCIPLTIQCTAPILEHNLPEDILL